MGTGKNAWRWFRRSAVIAAALAATTFVLVGSAGATGRYADKTGDNGAALDIAGAEVSSDTNGQLSFRVNIPNMSANGAIALFVDSDANTGTGNVQMGGVDRFFIVVPAERTFDFGGWNGSDWDFNIPSSTVRVSTSSSGLFISVNRSELNNASQLNFWVLTLTGDGGPGKTDMAPDDGLWNYDLAAGGPDIREVLVQTTPASGPRVGKQFAVTVSGIRLPQTDVADAIPPESYNCTATLAGRTLTGSGTGACTFRIPKKKAKGKQLIVTVTVSYEGATKSVQLPFKVKN